MASIRKTKGWASLFLAGLLSISACGAHAFDLQGKYLPGKASFGCAPFDGPAIGMEVDLGGGQTAHLRVWGNGIGKLAPGGHLRLGAAGPGDAGDGEFRICGKTRGDCRFGVADLTVEGYKRGVFFAGSFRNQGADHRFKALFSPAAKPEMFCG